MSAVGDMSLPVPGRDDLRFVAWHGGGAQTLRTGKRDLATVGATEGTGVRKTLCGHYWRRSREVTPDDHWTNGTCATCARRAGWQA